MTHKAENIYRLVIYRKSLLISELYHQKEIHSLSPLLQKTAIYL